MALRNSFMNFRRGCAKENNQSISSEPASKRKRVEPNDNREEISESEYDDAIETMKGEYQNRVAKKLYDPSEVKRLMI